MKRILVTGGAGYIGSHAVVAFLEAGLQVVLMDNFSNSQAGTLQRLEQITGQRIPFVLGDVRDTALLEQTLADFGVDAVLHFAGLKAVGESVEKPIDYYANNVQGTISLLQAMQTMRVKTLVFSSSATVYGEPQYLPLDENHPTGATNPYGRTKLHIERMLQDLAAADPLWRVACLRYFNPVGAHESGLIGECPNGIPNNLMPYIVQVAAGRQDKLRVFGDDYATHDGTGVRDYIHVMDLAVGHLRALDFLSQSGGWHAFNLGTGAGFSVGDVLRAFELATGLKVATSIVGRRPGDVGTCFADVEKATNMLGWRADRTLIQMCESSWAHYSK